VAAVFVDFPENKRANSCLRSNSSYRAAPYEELFFLGRSPPLLYVSRALSRRHFAGGGVTGQLLPVLKLNQQLNEQEDKPEKFSYYNSVAGTLSNYHIKTLMLWACELKPRSSWAENLNLVRICVELLHTLSVWLTDTRCPHYFVSDCNLLDNSFNVESVASELMSVDEECLSTWFIRHYVGQCARLCPFYVFNYLATSVPAKENSKKVKNKNQETGGYGRDKLET